jgi:DivIVA domain-containing protein
MRRKKADGQAAPREGGGRLTPMDVQQVEFRLALRGYNERDVDGFLDRITEDLSAYLEENERLRSGAGLPATPAATPVDVDAARREAEGILAKAREEAAAIVRRAEQQAAATGAATASGDARSAVAPFLNTEREFLQSLGSLVQAHAEEIKQMVLAVRERSEAARRPEAAWAAPIAAAQETVAIPDAEASAEDRAAGAATPEEIRERLGEPEPEDEERDEPTTAPGRASAEGQRARSATEPAYSSEGAPAGEGRERSLRELFWGED